jgi:hypothetical protein
MIIEFLNKYVLSPASFTAPGGFHVEGPVVFVVFGVIAAAILSVWSFLWIYRDASKRDKNGFLAVLFILMTGWPVSFIYWLWLRPPISETPTVK